VNPTELNRALRAAVSGNRARAERARDAAELIRRATRARWVGLYDVTASEISAIAWTGDEAPAHPVFPREQGLSGSAVASGSTIISNDVAKDPRYLTAFVSTGSEMIVPIRNNDSLVVGTIDVESERTRAFGIAERELVEGCVPGVLGLWIQDGWEL